MEQEVIIERGLSPHQCREINNLRAARIWRGTPPGPPCRRSANSLRPFRPVHPTPQHLGYASGASRLRRRDPGENAVKVGARRPRERPRNSHPLCVGTSANGTTAEPLRSAALADQGLLLDTRTVACCVVLLPLASAAS